MRGVCGKTLGAWVRRALILVLAIVVARLSATDSLPQSDISRQVKAVVGPNQFSLFDWEVRTLGGRLLDALLGRAPTDAAPTNVALVRQYANLVEQRQTLDQRREQLYVAARGKPDPAELAALDDAIAAVDRQRRTIEPTVERIVAAQISQTLRDLGIRRQLIEVGLTQRWPFVQIAITPDVFFSFERLPLLLVVAPRDRIEVTTSVFVKPTLQPAQIDALENRVDRLGVSSITVPIGGFAAYPSMIPEQPGIRQMLVTIAHEWTHHYLTMRPLGMRYFTSYALRTINETVADIAGQEIGARVYERYYAASEPRLQAPPAGTSAPTPRPGADFGARMRAIRARVEEYLKRHDVAGAEAYMAQAREELLADGFYVRKLNTAYLSFFGAYSGGGNPYEPKLRTLRQQAGSLRAFLERVSGITDARQLDALVSH